MSENTPPIRDSRHGRYTIARRGSAVTPWICGHALEHGFELDASQVNALGHFGRLCDDLMALDRCESPLTRLLAKKKRAVKGVYLWGGVGRGKSFIMDSFFNCVPFARKRRIHFHRFMQEIHHAMRQRQGEPDPLLRIARDLARDSRLICLDEFHVTDITDAMLMRRLLEGLFGEGAVLVTTSNIQPDDLYLYGLQRGQFLPAIKLIKQHLAIVELDGGVDYRLRELEKAGVYHTDPDAEDRLRQAFTSVARHETEDAGGLEIEDRIIRARKHARGVAWFDFHDLCEGPRAKADYIELARRYHTVLLAGVPRFTPGDADKLRRFVWLIDEFYDRRVKLIMSAAARAADLVDGAGAGDRFQSNLNGPLKERLVSRLTEMQTRAYLTRPHLP